MPDASPRAASLGHAAGTAARLAFPALILGALAIGLSPIFVRVSELGPTATGFHRIFLALPALALWMAAEPAERRPRGRADWLLVVLAGLFFAGDIAFWHWSIRFTSVANATLFANFAPVFVTVGGFLLFGTRVSRTFLIALALTLAGAVVLMGDSLSVSPDHLFGDVLGLITAAFYGAYILAVARLRTRVGAGSLMFGTAVVTAAALLPAALVAGEGLLAATLYGWAILFGLALVSHSAGQGLIAFSLAHLPPSFSSLTLLLQPVAAAVFAWALLGERLSVWQAIGGAVILAGIELARRSSR